MLQAGPGAPSDTRRVGAFTVTPDTARRLLKARVESAERRRAEEAVLQATGYRHVRFVEVCCHIHWHWHELHALAACRSGQPRPNRWVSEPWLPDGSGTAADASTGGTRADCINCCIN